jgi:hypothetical protein
VLQLTIPAERDAELSDVELLRRAVTYSPPCGFGVTEKWRAVGAQFGVNRPLARHLCERFGVDPDKLVARLDALEADSLARSIFTQHPSHTRET